MDNKNITNFNKILKTCPPDVKDQFTKSRPHLEECLNQEQMYAWADSGIKMLLKATIRGIPPSICLESVRS
ncbi:MAG: hypothetical protein CM1200mP8_1170 [Chloroflexota bacterium]|nr:MAG: hypothetical protein CM1200mP8_1170 [Chloroflexota bacterium]